ncbi:ethanolamine ammonia-lyase subunit EutC [Sporolactobacillus sp. THM19-2]|uniref:ethanolamine ammonia-lyase subunit EutC n=1 Tax=Sporolactobacillus sp. THM19-2 TaxID=2511171 RepID=UPI00197E6827|nr:ethanolamine ammonia-lyase subunit EutC [Sporolactobacillus sp. THM19-2]
MKEISSNIKQSNDDGSSLDDISKIDIRRQLLVPHPHNRQGYLKMKSFTPARLGLWRCGPRYMTQSVLRFRADHAAAQDAVFSCVDHKLIEEMNFIDTKTLCHSKDEYLTRPDLGRKLSEKSVEKIKKCIDQYPKIQIVVGDGLSSAAIDANIREILPSIRQGLNFYQLNYEKVIFVKYCRVGVMDHIGEMTNADVVCMLIGERPGLATAHSMSAYIAYRPTIGMPEARRTVVSNIHSEGIPAVEAGASIAELLHKMLVFKKSGLDLKEDEKL